MNWLSYLNGSAHRSSGRQSFAGTEHLGEDAGGWKPHDAQGRADQQATVCRLDLRVHVQGVSRVCQGLGEELKRMEAQVGPDYELKGQAGEEAQPGSSVAGPPEPLPGLASVTRCVGTRAARRTLSPAPRSTRDALPSFLHCKRDELALLRNCTEGNNIVSSGLDLKVGDEVLLTDQEHPGGRNPWEQKGARFGVKLNFVKLPRPPASVEEIVRLFEAALTPRTRIIVFSHITWETGLVLPAKEICKLARKHGILTHIDGAHGIGQVPLDLHDLGCDFYATNGHKWLMAPKGTGALFIREEHLERLWAHTVTEQWRNYKLKAYRFSYLGTSNLSVVVGVKAALDFFHAIGPEHIYARIHELGRKVRDRLREHPRIRLLNASADNFHAGLVSFAAVKGDLKRVKAECDARHIRIRYWEEDERIRVSTGIFTQQTELNAFFDALERGLRG